MKNLYPLIALLLLASCQFAPQLGKKDISPKELFSSSGSSALEFSIHSSSQNEIMMCQSGNLVFELKNSGISDANGILSVILDKEILSESENSKSRAFNIKAKSAFNPTGGSEFFELKLKSLGLPEQLEFYNTPVILQACYPYKTVANVQVCIDPDVKNLNPSKPCRSSSVSLSGGQGAPVALTRIEPLMITEEAGVKPVFVIYAQNIGSGNLISSQDPTLACISGANKKLLAGTVNLSASLPGNPLSCSPKPLVFEGGKETRFVCSADKAIEANFGTFSSVLTVTLDYGYINTVMFPVSITRLSGMKSC